MKLKLLLCRFISHIVIYTNEDEVEDNVWAHEEAKHFSLVFFSRRGEYIAVSVVISMGSNRIRRKTCPFSAGGSRWPFLPIFCISGRDTL